MKWLFVARRDIVYYLCGNKLAGVPIFLVSNLISCLNLAGVFYDLMLLLAVSVVG